MLPVNKIAFGMAWKKNPLILAMNRKIIIWQTYLIQFRIRNSFSAAQEKNLELDPEP